MEDLFLQLQHEIALSLPSLSMVDEDYGQLQGGEDTYPVTFPCVLINIDKIEWKTFARGIQQGSVNVTLRLCVDCYHDTHYGSGTEDKMRERMLLLGQLHETVSRITPPENTEPWERVSSRFFSLPGGIKVYETGYSCLVEEGMDG
jgi:hypothetical protein